VRGRCSGKRPATATALRLRARSSGRRLILRLADRRQLRPIRTGTNR
jgi:hypothetical protein